MNDKERSELDFWESWVKSHNTWQDYLETRQANYNNFKWFFPEIEKETGFGLDVGCGLVSIFHNTKHDVFCVDPLMSEYKQYLVNNWTTNPDTNGMCVYLDDYKDDPNLNELLKEESFDWVACINVIDHTDYYKKLISQMVDVLKDKGHLYLNVNFDPVLSPPAHCSLWDINKVMTEFSALKMIRGTMTWVDAWGKYQFWGLFEK